MFLVRKKVRRLEITKIRKEIIKYTLIVAVLTEAVSLLYPGPNVFFPYGLALGVCAAVINMNIISASIERAAGKGKKGPVHRGLAIRVLIYCAVFCLAAATAGFAAAGACIGFFLPRVAMYYVLGLRPAIRKKLGKEPRAVYVADYSSRVFFKDPWLVKENYNNKKRSYVTHKRFRKIRKEELPGMGKTVRSQSS